MKTVLLVILGCVLLLSCEKQEYESWRTFPDVSKVTRVNLSPNSPVLIADGKAELTFKVKAYMGVEDIRTIELENEDGVIVKDSTFRDTIEIKEDRIPKEDIKIYLEDGTPVDWAFRTTEHAGETLRFKASVYGVESEVREVRIIEKPEVNFEHITIPLIFHLLYKEDEAYQYENITTEMLQGMVDRLNRVMKNDMINAPSSVDLNVTFELAETDNLGKPLKERGINRVQLWDGIDGNSYINDYLIWDLDKYLNIWVGEHQDEYSLRIQYPQYILDNGSELQMDEWRTLQKVESVEDASYWGYTEVGIALNKKHLYNMPNASNWADMGGTSERFESCIGQFFGLYPTWWSPYGGAADDFCSDTYTGTDMSLHFEKWTYEPGAPSKNEYKNGHEIYFDSFNIMDQNTFCSTITYEQALRMRTVMENCPFRMMRK
ncbi:MULTISPECIES: hypothetical protein [Butyricimonas]|jgi:hypothetical protein|nr:MULTISPECIES: hypothetical protein [Butyricimonas]OKZ15436.1 MAG: hypothetical protein BHV81_15655 [Butyricimonas synergistica]